MYKLVTLSQNIYYDQAPTYLTDQVVHKIHRRQTRSNFLSLLEPAPTPKLKSVGERSFFIALPRSGILCLRHWEVQATSVLLKRNWKLIFLPVTQALCYSSATTLILLCCPLVLLLTVILHVHILIFYSRPICMICGVFLVVYLVCTFYILYDCSLINCQAPRSQVDLTLGAI